MLTDLRIRNLAIIEDVSLSFGAGLNLLTGETGAGKSIIVEALGLVTGARADAQAVRTGARSALVEATFETLPPGAAALAGDLGVEIEDGALLARREVGADGRSRAFLGGRAVPLSALRDLGELLVDLHGQHQKRTLLRPETHREALDLFAGLSGEREQVAGACAALRAAAAELERFEAGMRDRASRPDLLRFQLQEIEALDPRPGEEEALRADRSRLAHAARIAELCTAVTALLAEDDGSALDRLGHARRALEELGRLDPDLQPLSGRLAESVFVLEDIAAAVRTGGQLEADPGRLDAIETRLERLRAVSARHGADAAGLHALRARLAGEIERFGNAEDSERGLREARDGAGRAYAEAAGRLSRRRARAAGRLAEAVRAELSQLAFGRVGFEVSVRLRAAGSDPGGPGEQAPAAAFPEGLDEVEFLFSANAGEELRPLHRVASGGELSRVLLALTVALGRVGLPGTAVFDEVDAGIGGRTAEAVGERLERLAAGRQILCVTHLPQIACRAHRHWRIAKRETGGRTVLVAEALEAEQRVEELARMMAGREVTDTARRHARELAGRARGSGRARGRPRRSA